MAASLGGVSSFDSLPDELLALVVAKANVATLVNLSLLNLRCTRLVKNRMESALGSLIALPQQAFKSFDTSGYNPGLSLTKKLHLANRGIDDAKLCILTAATSAAALPLLEDLDLSYNTISDLGAFELAETLENGALTRLEHLHLTNNRIDDKGLGAIARVLGRGPALRRLRSLYMGGNGLGDDAAGFLAAAMRAGALPALKTLTLQNNPHLGDRGAKHLADAAQDDGCRVQLSWLNLAGTMVSEPARLACHALLTASHAHVPVLPPAPVVPVPLG